MFFRKRDRERIEVLEASITGIYGKFRCIQKALSIEECPNCKHEAMFYKPHFTGDWKYTNIIGENEIVYNPQDRNYHKVTTYFDKLCLSCGTKFVLEKSEEYKVVEEKKDK